MQSLVSKASTQFIDSSGKCRALIYESGGSKIALILHYPIHPLAINRELSVKPVEIEVAKAWVDAASLNLTAQTTSRGKVVVLHVSPKKHNPLFPVFYILVTPSPTLKLPDAPFTGQLYSSERSDVNVYQEHRRIATVLKAYALFTYSEDPSTFGEDSFVIEEDPEEIENWANVLTSGEGSHNSLLHDNPWVYDEHHRIKVPSIDIRRRLLEYVHTQTVKNELGVARVKDLSLVPGSYEVIGDFTPRKDQIIFTSREGLIKWCRNAGGRGSGASHLAHDEVTPEVLAGHTPFFLRDPSIQPTYPHIVLLQPVVDHELARAVSVSKFWIEAKTNSLGNQGLTTFRAPAASAALVAKAIVREHRDGRVPDLTVPSVLKVRDKYVALLYLRNKN
jgi:hypothetical protein